MADLRGVLMACNVRPLRNAQDSRAWPLPLPPSEKAIRAAYASGMDDGERLGHVSGWRKGFGHGLAYGIAAGMACLYGLIQLGQLLGA